MTTGGKSISRVEPGGAGRSSAASSTRPTRWAIAILVLLSVLVYGQTVTFGFVQLDDQEYVTGNVHVLGGLSWKGIQWAFSPTAYGANWIPLVWLSLMLDVEVWGDFAGGFHLTNVALHTINAALLFVLLNRMTGSAARSLLVAALFCVHPLHVESVAWVSERKDVLSTFFGLIASLFYVRFTRTGSLRACAASLVAFLPSLLSKQMLVTLPVLMLLLDWWPLQRLDRSEGPLDRPGRAKPTFRQLVIEKLPFVGLSILSSAIAIWAQTAGQAVQALERYPLGDRIGNAALSCWRYLGKLFWPFDLAVFYPLVPPARSEAVVALLALVGATSIAWRCRRTLPAFWTGWGWYLVSLLPVIGIIQVGNQALADRYTYVPMIGISVALVWTFSGAFSAVGVPRPLRWATGLVIVLAAGVLGFRQCRLWENSERLLTHTLAVTEANWFAETALGGVQMVDPGRVAEAESRFRKALALNPDYPLAHYHLGLLLSDRGSLVEANEEFRRTIEFWPQSLDARMFLCINLQRLGAEEELQRELERTQSEVAEIPVEVRRVLQKLRSSPVGNESR
ncbi:hypothetical protein Pan44_43350 [Caulifigura coniformis]|uniref:Uncharacterized protein n=2 Tax=Caulifigura coniformis TaxID=2527983 RepID=A0A517SJI4_9PLAN|nr:hypothetical protein Pan44_43350 [Caulifigura coniformis]